MGDLTEKRGKYKKKKKNLDALKVYLSKIKTNGESKCSINTKRI